jgi:hypothetical protein
MSRTFRAAVGWFGGFTTYVLLAVAVAMNSDPVNGWDPHLRSVNPRSPSCFHIRWLTKDSHSGGGWDIRTRVFDMKNENHMRRAHLFIIEFKDNL